MGATPALPETIVGGQPGFTIDASAAKSTVTQTTKEAGGRRLENAGCPPTKSLRSSRRRRAERPQGCAVGHGRWRPAAGQVVKRKGGKERSDPALVHAHPRTTSAIAWSCSMAVRRHRHWHANLVNTRFKWSLAVQIYPVTVSSAVL
jgi:hypothetical protein